MELCNSKIHIYLAAMAIPMKILVEAYGCTMNRGEAEEFIDGLLDMGHELVEEQDDAGAFVLFTCDVIETTENHMLKRIGEFAAMPEKTLMVCGCLPNISPRKILGIAPHAILIGATEHLKGLSYFKNTHHKVAPPVRPCSIGILPIASGCMGSCSYCITKNARHGLRSRNPDDLIERLKNLLARGTVEIQLCAQDTAIYGNDIDIDLARLVELLEAVDGDFMMRIGMMNPAAVLQNMEKILRAFQSPKVFKFLHLPVQSGSDAVLERMKRRHTVEQFEEIVRMFRSQFPEMNLSTDIIVGFPGETDGDFQKSLELIERTKPDMVNITRFSSRPGTEAHSMKNRVPSRIAKDRSAILTDLRFSQTDAKYGTFEGRTFKALATERRAEGTTFLRTSSYKPIVLPNVLELGKWYEVRVVGSEKAHLTGVLTT
jgi:threonylcarbamoyladenosine tRNA methylthiotransferase CDKAL1